MLADGFAAAPRASDRRGGAFPWLLVAGLAAAACSPPVIGDDLDAGPGAPDAADAGPDAPPDAGPPDAGPATPDAGVPVELRLRSVTPPRGGLAGGSIVALSGRGFVDGFARSGGTLASSLTTVAFGGNAAIDLTVIDDDTIEVRTPPGLRGAVDVTLANPNGEVTCTGCFSYLEGIELGRITPTQGTTRGGDAVTLAGKGFVDGMLVLVGGQAATDVVVAADGASLTARTPPGTTGSADVGVVGPNSAAFLRRAFVYLAPMALTAVEPPVAPVGGGTAVRLLGSGFSADNEVLFGATPAASVEFVSDGELLVTTPAVGAPGTVDVAVSGRRGQVVAARAFAFVDAARRDTALFGLSPRQGSPDGAPCVANGPGCVRLFGAGFAAEGLAVRIGASEARVVQVLDDQTVEVELPPGAPGLVDVQVRTVRGGAVLADAFAYVPALVLSGIDPPAAAAGASPAVVATVSGAGLSADCRFFVGADEAAFVSAGSDGAAARITLPPGSAGSRDLRVSCGAPDSPLFREAVLAGALTYTAPLTLLQVDPDNGAIAGNTAVNLYGVGFTSELLVQFGRDYSTDVVVKSPFLAVMHTPRGAVGVVDVKARQGAESVTLPGAFSYFDPTNILGGASGGPMRGTLNVTVLNDTPGMSGPVPGVRIAVNADQLVGLTDDRGQVTFSDAALLKPVSITGSKEGFAAATIAKVDARNITLFMEMNEGGPPSEPPPPPPPAVLSGRVCGFKVPPGTRLQRGQRLEARVYMSAPYVYAAPPFESKGEPVVVLTDCGAYTVRTRNYGALALYAEFGIADTAASPPSFAPLLMGIKRGLEAAPDKEDTGLDIILDMHRDVNVPIRIDSAEPPPGRDVLNLVFSYLDLGGEGVIPLAEQESTASEFLFERHPRVGGEGLIFLNLAMVLDPMFNQPGPPYSFFYRRQYGELGAGVEIGPMLAFTQLRTPANGGLFSGSLGWSFTAGQRADVQQILVREPGLPPKPIWNVILPGTELSASLPTSVLATFPPGTGLQWVVITARAPRFDYDRFGYQQLGVNAWTSFTQDFGSFRTP